ncbi:hypothetical protein X750_31995 [Mesorhizobium sp. LNJC394B00]|nr:hypothetical protein X750_31995 [Mesorhizobium sp. LNJC394B00]
MLDAFIDGLDNSKEAVFFFAGHGIQVDGDNYILPKDVTIKQQSDLDNALININKLVDTLAKKSKIAIVFLDACRNDPFEGLGGGRGVFAPARGLNYIEVENGVYIAFACAPGKTAADNGNDPSDSENSPFTSALLAHISTPSLPIDVMMTAVTNTVLNSTDGQRPWRNTSLNHDYAFAIQSNATHLRTTTDTLFLREEKRQATDPNVLKIINTRLDQLEAEYLATAIEDDNFPKLDRYLSRFPDGKLVSTAVYNRQRLRRKTYIFSGLAAAAAAAASSGIVIIPGAPARTVLIDWPVVVLASGATVSIRPDFGVALFAVFMGWIVARYFDLSTPKSSTFVFSIFACWYIASIILRSVIPQVGNLEIPLLSTAVVGLVSSIFAYISLYPSLSDYHFPGMRIDALVPACVVGIAVVGVFIVFGFRFPDPISASTADRLILYGAWQIGFALAVNWMLLRAVDRRLKSKTVKLG